MNKKWDFRVLFLIMLFSRTIQAQVPPGLKWTLLPAAQRDEIIGEASGETAFRTMMEIAGYSHNRPADEYKGTFYECRYILDQLIHYGLSGAEIVRFPGGETWDGIMGELWEVTPRRQKLASYQDLTAMLVSGSNSADVSAELVWVGRGTADDMQAKELAGKIVVTDGNPVEVHNLACLEKGAEGVIAISQSRLYADNLQIPWGRISGSRDGRKEAKFAFYLSAREGNILKERLQRQERITVHARVKSQKVAFENQDVVAHIPGTDPDAGEIILSAHLFEGLVKQSANDNASGCAAILEVARTLNALIMEKRLPRPKRAIRFLWGPEISGTGAWVKANRELMKKTLCNIDMDMVGELLSKNQSFMTLARTTYGNPHYINDVMENYYRFVGETNREKYGLRGVGSGKYSHRIVAPTGADEPFYYSIETHSGGSDHEVFNDWSVGIPGVMMGCWPDQWYHTSGDTIDKSDPTQLKRAAAIGAMAAYTVASADDAMAEKIASETAGNASRRLGHQLQRGLEKLNDADAKSLADAHKAAWIFFEMAARNEAKTLATVRELAVDKNRVEAHIQTLQKALQTIGRAHMAVLEAHMKAVAGRLRIKPVKLLWTTEEREAARLIPRPTSHVKENGYGGYRDFIDKVSEEDRKKYGYTPFGIFYTHELYCLIDGKNNLLDIKNNLYAQIETSLSIQTLKNHLELLKLAGLITL